MAAARRWWSCTAQAVRVGIGGGSGGVEQDEDTEVASELAAVKVDMFRWRVAGAQIDEKIDECLDVGFVAIGAGAQNLRSQAHARQASPEHVVVRNTGVCNVGGDRERKVDDPAPLGSVPVVVHVPLRIQGPAHADCRTGLAVIGEMDPGGQWSGIRSGLAHSSDRANRCLRAGSAVPGRATAAEEFA